jgi:hypothetical protein
MLIKLLYILFIATADFFLYSMLNKTGKVGLTLLRSFWIVFLLVVILHTGIFKLEFLLPFEHFILIIQFLVELIIFHFIGNYFIAKTQRNTRLSPQVASYSVKMASFLFLKAAYILTFAVQCIFNLTRHYIR